MNSRDFDDDTPLHCAVMRAEAEEGGGDRQQGGDKKEGGIEGDRKERGQRGYGQQNLYCEGFAGDGSPCGCFQQPW